VINEGNLPVLARKGVGLHVDARLGRRGGELARRIGEENWRGGGSSREAVDSVAMLDHMGQ
jgi:hypothetical protein